MNEKTVKCPHCGAKDQREGRICFQCKTHIDGPKEKLFDWIMRIILLGVLLCLGVYIWLYLQIPMPSP